MAVSGHRKSRINSTVLESLLKLRLFCNNGSSNRVIHTSPAGLPSDPDEALSYLQQNDQAVCVYCIGPIYSINNAQDTDGGIWIALCSHLVCRNCLPQHRANKQLCPCKSNDKTTPLSSQNSGSSTPLPPTSSLVGDASIPMSNSSQHHLTQDNTIFEPHPEHQYPSKLLAFLEDIQKQTHHKRYTITCR